MYEAEFQVNDFVSVKGGINKCRIRFIEADYAVVRKDNETPFVVMIADLAHIGKVCTDCKRPLHGNSYYGRCGFCEYNAHGR